MVLQEAVDAGDLSRIRDSLTETVQKVEETFAEQKREYEERLAELNERMVSLRQEFSRREERRPRVLRRDELRARDQPGYQKRDCRLQDEHVS